MIIDSGFINIMIRSGKGILIIVRISKTHRADSCLIWHFRLNFRKGTFKTCKYFRLENQNEV